MRLVVWCSLALLLLGISNLLQAPALLGIFFLTFLMYISGKINPKINSMLLSKLPPEVLAQTSNFLTMLFTFSIPLGSMLFTSLGLWNMGSAWLLFSLLGGICLLLKKEGSLSFLLTYFSIFLSDQKLVGEYKRAFVSHPFSSDH